MQDNPSIQLHISQEELLTRLKKIKAWLFDWDGVFNDGHKGADGSNTFCERDSMGTNMLRYAHYIRTGEQAFCAVITGATNQTPKFFGQREHFHAVVPGALYKRDVVEKLLEEWGIAADEMAFVFDDILDLNVCEIAGLRVQVRYPSSQMLNNFVDEKNLVDVFTTMSGKDQAVRNLMQYFITQLGYGEQVIHGRMHVSDEYKTYFDSRQQIKTTLLSRAEMLAK